MGGHSRDLDDVSVEWLWRMVNHGEVYLWGQVMGGWPTKSFAKYFDFFRDERCIRAVVTGRNRRSTQTADGTKKPCSKRR
jgi:hypothetical protein